MKNASFSSPIVTGLALLGAGFVVRRWRPSTLTLPDRPENGERRDRGVARVARKSRDGVASILPSNMTGSIARSLMIMGAGLILVRALDELVEDEDAIF